MDFDVTFEENNSEMDVDFGEIQMISNGSADNSYIPSYWEDHLESKIARIKNLQYECGKDGYSFVVLTDYHSYSNARNSPSLIKRVMDECGIKFCLCLGDIQNQGTWGTRDAELADWKGIEKDFKPIRDRTLMVAGNHDGAYGSADINGDGVISGTTDYYIYNLTQEEMYELIYRKVGLIDGVHFDETCNGYYVDDPTSKVRYLLVNAHYSDCAVNEDGTAVNNYMRKSRIGQSQHNMIIDALSSIPDNDWTVVVGTHMPLVTFEGEGGGGDLHIFLNVLLAYQNKTTYSGTFGDVGAYDRVNVSVDFTSAKGSVVGAFAGHLHKDLQNTDYDFPIILSRSDGRPSEEKYTGTTREQSFDVFTVNKKTGNIYATKIGDGENRLFESTINDLPYTNLADRTSEDWYDNGWLHTVTVDGVSTTTVNADANQPCLTTNFIPVTQYDILRFKGLDTETYNTVAVANPALFIYDENKNYLGYLYLNSAQSEAGSGIYKCIEIDENGVSSYTILLNKTGAQFTYSNWCTLVKYVRFCCNPSGLPKDVIITVNEEIV